VAQNRRGCGCILAVIIVVVIAALLLFYFFRSREKKVPPPSGDELQVHVLNVGQGDSVLIVAPGGKSALVDAGVPGSGRTILDALRRYNVSEINLLIATHAHADHIGAADEVINSITVRNVLDSGAPNDTKNYADFLEAAQRNVVGRGGKFITATPGQTFDMGGGARVTVLAPFQPFFTKEQLRAGGNEPNANSIVMRLDYGDFSMLLTGDAEAQTEQRMITNGENIAAKILKVGHHGSRYATSDEFLRRGRFEAAIISDGADNRYGHPSQEVLDRLRGDNIKVYRTDLQGEITITTRGREYQIKPEHEATGDLWAGRAPQKDDSARSGFIQYGDFGPAPRQRHSNKAR
jgi:beta-lactamase superfamily II metal-dependent hydrolase